MGNISLFQNKNFYIILTVTLLSVIGVTSIIPVFPDMSQALNVSLSKIGLFITVFTLPGALLSPVIGMIIDRVGRKRILITALILFGITGTLCFFLRNFETILVLRFFQGIGGACLGIINFTLIGDVFSGDQKAKAMGYNSGAILVGSAIFPAVGGVLALIKWYFPFLLPAIALVVAIWVFVALDTPEPKEKVKLNHYIRKTLGSILKRESVTLFLLSFATFFLLFGTIMTYMPVLLKNQFGLSSSQIGFMLFCLALATALVASQVNRFYNTFSMKVLIFFGFGSYLLGFALIPFVNHIYLVLILMMIIGVGQGINIPAIFHVLTNIAPSNHRGAFMSINSMSIRGGQTIGPLIAGLLFGLWGLSWVFWSAAGLSILFVILVFIFVPTLNLKEESVETNGTPKDSE